MTLSTRAARREVPTLRQGRRRRTWLIAVLAMVMAWAMTLPASAESSEVADSGMANSNADFPVWHQGFNHDTEGWITDETPGLFGWCGDIQQIDRAEGAVRPSAGRGYAVVEHGACNDFYDDLFPEGSGPGSSGVDFSTEWPAGGFVYELDVHLDPAWEAGTSFVLSASFNQPDMPYPTGVRYFTTNVTATGDAVLVGDHEVTEAGWYTFRYVFASDAGVLDATFQLTDHGRTLDTVDLATTVFTGESTGSFDVADVGTGYIYFVMLSDGLDLPIDEHRMRPGS